MGTQTNVKFSRVSVPIAEALAALRDNAFDPLKIELRKFSRIQPTYEPEFPGYDAIGKLLKLRTVEAVLAEVGHKESFGLGYLVGVPAYIYLNFFEFNDDGTYSLLLTFDSSLLHYTDDENDAGDVLERILSRIVETLEIDVCGYNSSDRYAGEFDSLTINEIVDGIRSGDLLEKQPPFYYAIRTDYISTQAILSVSSPTAAKYKLRGAYHFLCGWIR